MTRETPLAICVVAALVAVPVLTVVQDHRIVAALGANGAKVVTLTGVAESGVWTSDTVNCGNYWWKRFDRAVMYFEVGDEVVLRLQSADVHHRFYVPALGIDHVDVEPGHTEVVRFRAEKPGTFRYYCTSACGICHFHMTGWIVISPKGQRPEPAVSQEALAGARCPEDLPKLSGKGMINRGKYLYEMRDCYTCHGKAGRGGIMNFNFANKTVPAHNTLAEKFSLTEKEDADAFIKLLIERANLDELLDNPPDDVPQFTLVVTRYRFAKKMIVEGRHSEAMDKTKLEPPLQMPSWRWREELTDYDIDSIFAYLLSLYAWDEEYEEYEDDEE